MARQSTSLTAILRRMVAEPLGRYSDRQLLERFADKGDEVAFGEILSRHGPMLLGLCRRELGDAHLAEDVLQATFLVLARKSRSIRRRESLADWLYGVALRLARRSRVECAARSRRERLAAGERRERTESQAGWDELLRVLDEELQRLPERYRLPLLLCYLESRTQDEAAKQLGWSLNTLRCRLERGRELLKIRMTRRGATLGAGLFAGVLAPSVARAGLSVELRKAVLSVVMAGGNGTVVPAAVLVLAGGAMRMSVLGKVILWAATFLATGATVAGVIWQAGQGTQVKEPPQSPGPAPIHDVVGTASSQQSKKVSRLDALGDPLPDGAIARLGTLRFKHIPAWDGVMYGASFSPDGMRIVSLMGNLCLWDAATGKEIGGPWSSSNQSYSAAAFSPNGALLAAATNPRFRSGNPVKEKTAQEQIILYDITATKPAKTLGRQHVVRALAFADGGETLISAGQGTIAWWDVATGKEQRLWKPFSDEKQPIEGGTKTKTFDNCALAPNGTSIVVQVAWQTERAANAPPQKLKAVVHEVIGYDLATSKIIWRSTYKGFPHETSLLAYSGDGKRVAIAMAPGTVELRDAVTGKLIFAPLESKFARVSSAGVERLGGLALSSDGCKVALANEDSNAILWDSENVSAPRKFVTRLAATSRYLLFSPDNKTLLVGTRHELQHYDVATLKESDWKGHRGRIDYVTFAMDSQRLLTGSTGVNFESSQDLAAWDVSTWKRSQLVSSIQTPPWPNVRIASPDLSVYVGKSGDHLRLYDLGTGKPLADLGVPSKPSLWWGWGFFSPSGKHYVLEGTNDQGERIAFLFAVPSGKALCQLPALTNVGISVTSGRSVAFSCDERLVALFGRDQMIHICDTATGKVRHRLDLGLGEHPFEGTPFAPVLAFSLDAKFLTSWSPATKMIRVWDVALGMDVLNIELGEAPDVPVRFAWSPDSRMLAVGQSRIRLLELATSGVRRELPGHQEGTISALSFSPNGRVLASGSTDTTVLIWDMSASNADEVVTREPGALEKRWQALAEDDAAKAYAAIRDLTTAPEASVAWLKKNIKPARPIDAKRVDDLISQLDDNQFIVRQKAVAELMRIGEQVMPAIDKALDVNPTLEKRLRLQDLRKRMTGVVVLKGERLQASRAVEVLERIGTPQSRQLLASLADGAAGALVTTQAQAALARLAK